MARAICSKCGKDVYWYAGRGMRLADERSSCCDAPLKGPTKGTDNKNKGEHFLKCEVCDALRLPKNIVHPNVDFTTSAEQNKKIFPRGIAACRWHDFIPAGKK